jgi:signal transduction histidine kinase
VDVTERRRAERYRQAQHAAIRALAEAPSLECSYAGVLSALGQALGWDVGVLWSVDDREGVLRCAAAWHDDDAFRGFADAAGPVLVARGAGPAGRVWAVGGPAWTDDVHASLGPDRGLLARQAGLRSSLAVPLRAGPAVVGVLQFYGRRLRPPDPALLDVLATLSTQIGDVLARRRGEAEAERLKDEFVGLVSHELRTPLTSIVGYLELLQEDEHERLSSSGRQFVDVIGRNSRRLMRLVGDLLFVVQVEARPLVVPASPVDLAAVVHESVESARPLAEEKGVALVADLRPAGLAAGDQVRLAQVVDNLVANALKFTPSSGRVDVRVGSRDDVAVVVVRDTGVGIPAADHARLFQRFFRASNAAERETPGVGLGLTIVRAIVEAHGGSIQVASREGEGATFTVELPLEPRAVATAA